ncbi:MAG: DNA repair protein RecO [bacterium]|nr:DNA repair protein RecO [bacterium]
MLKYTNGIIIEKSHLPRGRKLLLFCKNIGLCWFFYPYKIKNLNLDTLNLISFQIKKNKDYMFISQYRVINYYEKIRRSFNKKIIAQTIFEIIKKTVPENQKENKLYNMIISFINYLEKTDNNESIFKNFNKLLVLLTLENGYTIQPTDNTMESICKIEKLIGIEINSKALLSEILINEKVQIR